jgi:hypothetical protein
LLQGWADKWQGSEAMGVDGTSGRGLLKKRDKRKM